MEVTDDMLMALADGELDPGTAAALQAKVAADPALAARLAVFTGTASALREAFEPGPVPDHLIRAIIDAPAAEARPAAWGLRLAAGVAAVAIGLGGYYLGQAGNSGAAAGGDWADFAASHATSLATGSEAALPEGGQLRMLGSYETDQGLCRMASVTGAAFEERGILCREGEGWQVALRIAVPAGEGFQPASDTLSGLADQWLDGAGAGAALDPAAEAAALQRKP